jgi:hypothetical protein
MLAELMKSQKELFKKFNKNSTEDVQIELLSQIHHCIEELIEVRRELPKRKNWGTKQYEEPNWELVKEEAIDAFHFLLNIFILLDMNSEDVAYAYYAKDVKNNKRIDEWEQQKLDDEQEAAYL